MDVMALRRSIITGNHRLPFRERTVVGNPVSFRTNAAKPLKECDVSFAPVQNFNGYGYPWPGGKGKNLLNKDDAVTGYILAGGTGEPEVSTKESAAYVRYIPVTAGETYTISCTCTSTTTWYIRVHGYDSSNVWTGQIDYITTDSTQAYTLTFTIPEGTVSIGVSFNVDFYTNFQLELGSTESSYAPYENICPIEGWGGFNVGATGKNLLGGIVLANAVVSAMPAATISTENKYVSFAAGATVAHCIVGFMDDGAIYGFKFKENTRYTFILSLYKNSGTGGNLRIVYTDGTTKEISVSSAATKETVVVVTDEGKTIKRLVKRNLSGTTRIYYEESGIFEGVLTAQDFEEWSGNIYPVIFPTLGKNLFNPALAEPGCYTDTGAKHAQSASNYEYRMTNYIPVDGIEKVTVGYANLPSGETKWNSICWYDENKNFMERSAGTSGTNLTVFTVPEGAKYVRANMRTYNNGVEYCFLAYGEEAFEPFDNTEYGGTINIITGILTIDRQVIVMDGVTAQNKGKSFANKGSNTEVDGYYAQLYCSANNVATIALTENNADLFICSHAPTLVWKENIIVGSPYPVAFSSWYLSSGTKRQQPRLVFKKELGVDTTAKANAFLQEQYVAGTPVTYTVPLANPIVYQLDPKTIASLKGTNSIYSDANGNIEVTYFKRG